MTVENAPASPPRAAMHFGSRIRQSPYFAATLRWGAREFSVYNRTCMPVSYGDPQGEYDALTNAATLWDVSCERQVQIGGRGAWEFAQYLTPRNLSECPPGRCRYVLITNARGGVINDPVLLRLEENLLWLSAADSDLLLWCEALAVSGRFDVDISEPDVAPLQLQGPRSADVAAAVFGEEIRKLRYFYLRELQWENAKIVVSRTGWSGELGYEIYPRDSKICETLWEKILEAGKPFGIRPAAPTASRRIEGGLISCGADTTGDDSPMHLGLERFINWDGAYDYVGKKALLQLRESGVGRKLIGVEMQCEPLNEKPLTRWWSAFDSEANRIGEIRSAAYSPRLKKNIGVAMLKKPHCEPGARASAKTEYGGTCEFTARELPFVKPRAAG